jgi:hypothetical protein
MLPASKVPRAMRGDVLARQAAGDMVAAGLMLAQPSGLAWEAETPVASGVMVATALVVLAWVG